MVTMRMTLQTMNLDYSNNALQCNDGDGEEDGWDVARAKGGLIDDWPFFAFLPPIIVFVAE